MKATAIIVAAGSGKRLGAGRPKALVEACGVPLVIHSLRAMLAAPGISAAVVAVPGNARSLFNQAVASHGPWSCPISLVAGGAERQDSVRAGLTSKVPFRLVVLVNNVPQHFRNLASCMKRLGTDPLNLIGA